MPAVTDSAGALEKSLPRTFRIGSAVGEREIDIYSEEGFRVLSALWTRSGWHNRLSYQVTWLGLPVIQLPEDLLMMQELIYKVRPDVVVETGTAHGGSAIFYSSILELLGKGRVISVDVEIRQYNRLAINAHPLSKRVTLIEGSSVDDATVDSGRSLISPSDVVLVALDSNHTRAHVLSELERYAPLVTSNSYVVVFDGIMEYLTDTPRGAESWRDDNPTAAITDFVARNPDFEIDPHYNRLGATHSPGGFLRRNAVKSAAR